MSLSLALVLLIATPQLHVDHPQRPAKGEQETLIHVDTAGMIHIAAKSEQGSACALVDRQRGQFASSGVPGGSNCDLNLLLDRGDYLLRLRSRDKGKGQIKISAKRFVDIDPHPTQLPAGAAEQSKLSSGKTLRYWVHLDKDSYEVLNVFGAQAGQVRLWRNGEWVEAISARDMSRTPKAGQPIFHWQFAQQLEAGDYLLAVYGVDGKTWTKGSPSDQVFVQRGYPVAPEASLQNFLLPDWGETSFVLPKNKRLVTLYLPKQPTETTRLQIIALKKKSLQTTGPGNNACSLEKTSTAASCAVSDDNNAAHLVTVQGAPGSIGTLRWAKLDTQPLNNGEYATGLRNKVKFVNSKSATSLVELDFLSKDGDAGPLSCILLKDNKERRILAYDLPVVGDKKPLMSEFNYAGRQTDLWFAVEDSASYEIKTSGEASKACELYRFGEQGQDSRLSKSAPKAKKCALKLQLDKGRYRLKLYNGERGVEHLSIAAGGGTWSKILNKIGLGKDKKDNWKSSPHKLSCRFDDVKLRRNGRYIVAWSNNQKSPKAVGIQLRESTVKLDAPLVVSLNGQQRLSLPISAAGQISVFATRQLGLKVEAGGQTSRVARAGQVFDTGRQNKLRLINPSDQGLKVILARPEKPLPRVLPSPYAPRFAEIDQLKPGRAKYWDFDRQASHSLRFEVAEPGLYELSTLGLLDTQCSLRTAVAPQIAKDKSSGRGRNCQIMTMLNPGQYLATIQTRGASQGRAGVLLRRRPPTTRQTLKAGQEAFFRVPKMTLIQQPLQLDQSSDYVLNTSAQGQVIRCRLEDAAGWPLGPVPSSCNQSLHLKAGRYLWTQLPLDVESMRRSQVQINKQEQHLSGDDVEHTIDLNQNYNVDLGHDGKDSFAWTLGAKSDVDVLLNNGMQGRVQRQVGKNWEDVALVAPQDLDPFLPAQAPCGPYGCDDNNQEYDGEGYEGEDYEGEACDSEYGDCPQAQAPQALDDSAKLKPETAPTLADLAPGHYRLLTQHRRGDVGVSYQLAIRSRILVPGMHVEVKAPKGLVLRMPKTGMVRIMTRGDTDLRCRLHDDSGRVVASSRDVGEDWNCAIVRPLKAGDYWLELETENNLPGASTVLFSTPKEQELPSLDDGKDVSLGALTAATWLRPDHQDQVQIIVLKGDADFSCSVEDSQGRLLKLSEDRRNCTVLLHATSRSYKLRLWTRGQTATLKLRSQRKAVRKMYGRSVSKDQAGLLQIKQSGRYSTAKGAWCINEADQGLLYRCGPQASLQAGQWIFAQPDPRSTLNLDLKEIVLDSEQASKRQNLTLGARQEIQRQRQKSLALHLLNLQTRRGAKAHPACQFVPGIMRADDDNCYSVALGKEALGQWWSSDGQRHQGTLWRKALRLPNQPQPLALGASEFQPDKVLSRLTLPTQSFALSLVLPATSWAVLIDSEQTVVDFCPPEAGDRVCQLNGNSGELLVYNPHKTQLRAELILSKQQNRRVRMRRLIEAWPKAPGRIVVHIDPAKKDRQLIAEAEQTGMRCRVQLNNGQGINGCAATLPTGLSADIYVQHPAGPWRAMAFAAGREESTRWRWGITKTPGPKASAAQSQAVRGHELAFTLQVSTPGLVKIDSDTGICSLLDKSRLLKVDGYGTGCHIERYLPAGSYRVQMRAFAKRAMLGRLVWTHEPLAMLGEGAGPLTWIAPGHSRYFLFKTHSPGQVGLGLQVNSDRLRCRILDLEHHPKGEGCQQLTQLPKGSFLLEVRAPDDGRAQQFTPVLLGLEGAERGVPPDYLKDFFQRVGGDS